MKKRILTCVVSFIMLFSMTGVACDRTNGANELVWKNYFESAEAYVSEIYYYSIPEVIDRSGTTYEVFVDVADESGKEVDSFGGFFLVEKAEEYKITYSIDNGANIYSKVTKVVGIEKAKYELSSADLIFGLNEVIDLDGKVSSTVTGDIVYSAKKGEESIAIVDNSFTATETGVYTIQAKIAKQPTYSFDIFVVDRAEYPYADGMVLDGVDKTDIVLGTTFDDLTAEVSFDETKKYDSQSNGSYKIQTKTTGTFKSDGQTKKGVAETRSLDFSLKPAYSSSYYKALQKNGYEYIAIRYMIEKSEYDGTTRFDYISGSGKDAMALYYNGSKVVDKSEATGSASYTYWNYQLAKVPNGGWAEMLLDIDKFATYYTDEEISLFQIIVNANSYWDMTMYIDNIYAVKGEARSTTATNVVDKGAEVDLSSLASGAGMKNEIRSIAFDGEIISVPDATLKIENYGLYSVDITDRTMYGSVKQEIIAKGSVLSYAPSNFSATHGTANGSMANFSAEKVGENAMKISPNVVGTMDANWTRTTYTVKPLGGVEYYQQLKNEGYQYITYEYTLDYGEYSMRSGTSVYRAALTKNKIPHYNSDGLKADTAATHQWLCVNDNTSGDTSTKTSNIYFQATSYADTLWNKKTFIVSVSIDDFIKFYDANGINILTLYFSLAQPEMDYSVTFGRMFPTKAVCTFENN